MPSSDMDTERPKSREDAVLTENTDDFIIGDRVWVNGTKPGYIQYLGETRFSPGDWAGVVLDDYSGKNDGCVAGVKYFQCEPKRGVFARLHKLTRYPLLHATPPPTKLGDAPTPPPIHRCLTPTRTPSPGARNLREGERVTVSSSSGPPKTGVLRYLGQTDFAAGEWAGIELDDPLGKNDGTVAGKRYFRCSPNFGLFAPSHKVTRITGSLDRHRRTHNSDSDKEHGNHQSQHGSTQSLQDEHRKYMEESEKRAQRLRQLLEAAEAERRDLAAKLDEERRKVEELEFRIEEESIGKDDLQMEREKERQKIEDLERRLEQEERKNEMFSRGASPDSILKDETKRLNEEIKAVRDKLKESEAKIKDLQNVKQTPPPPQPAPPKAEELRKKEEALLQAQLSLDNKKREIQNLLDRIAEQERELQKSKSRQSKQLDTIDDLNIKLQKVESRCSTLEEELHSSKEKTGELDRRLQASEEQVCNLEGEKQRLEKQLLYPESTPKEQALLSRLEEKEKDVQKWRKEAESTRSEADKFREEREKMRKEMEEKLRLLAEKHREESRKERKRFSETEERSLSKVRELENLLSEVRVELESARVEAETRLSRQEERLREAELRTDSLDQLRDQISRLQAEKELIRVEKEETLKRLQFSEQSRTRWESEANRASAEVNLLKSQVQHLRNEFTTHREDLIQKLAETRFDAEAVQDLHTQIEEQRHVLEEMQFRLKSTEGERDQLQTALKSSQHDQTQVENGLRQDVENLKRRLAQAETINDSLKRSCEAAQLLLEETKASQKQTLNIHKVDAEKSVLENKIVDLQVELAALKNGKAQPVSDQSYEQLKSEKEALEQQINFMNSVIVDMQHKNDDLRSRLDILETEVIFDGHLQLGGIGQHRSISHLFCDICNVFDIHDTEDCPKQRSIRRTPSYSSQESEF